MTNARTLFKAAHPASKMCEGGVLTIPRVYTHVEGEGKLAGWPEDKTFYAVMRVSAAQAVTD